MYQLFFQVNNLSALRIYIPDQTKSKVGQATLFVQNGIQTAELQDYTT
jgi:hypothetical protein